MSTLVWNRLVGALVYDCKLQGNNTALTYACLVNDLAMVSILLKAGAYPNTCNKVWPHNLSCKAHYSQVFSTQSGQTPLLLAVKNNNVGIVGELVGARVDVNQMEVVSDTCDCVSAVYGDTVLCGPGRTVCSDVVL